MKHLDDDGFECIDEHSQTLKNEQELRQAISKLTADNALLRKEIHLKEGFRELMEAERKGLREQIGRLEGCGEAVQRAVGRLVDGDRGRDEHIKALSTFNSSMTSLRDSLSNLSKSLAQKCESLKLSEQTLTEQIRRSYKQVKDEMSNLYQQIIDQKNKQIKGLKAKVDDQRRIQETQETANAILQKTSLVEENTKLLVGFMGQLQAKDRELGEARTRIMQLEKSLVVKEVENEKLQEQIRSMSKEIAFKDELLENNSKELVNKQLALMNSESRFEDTIAVIKNLQATLKDKQLHISNLDQSRMTNANLSCQIDTGFCALSDKLQLIEYQLNRSHQLTELFQIFQQKVTDAIKNTKQNNLAFFFENIHERLLHTLPEQKTLLVGIRNDLRMIIDDIDARKLSEELKRYPPGQSEERKSMFEIARKKIDNFDFFEV